MKNTGLIYKILFPNGKCYIGQTIQGLEKRIHRHHYEARNDKLNRKICNALKKYPKETIHWMILHDNININELNNLEILEINNNNSYLNGYNSTTGGEGIKNFHPVLSLEHKRKISHALKGLPKSLSHCLNLSKANKGKKLSEETKKRMALARIGKKRPNWIFKKENHCQWREDLTLINIQLYALCNNFSQIETLKKFNVSRKTLMSRLHSFGFKNWLSFCKSMPEAKEFFVGSKTKSAIVNFQNSIKKGIK